MKNNLLLKENTISSEHQRFGEQFSRRSYLLNALVHGRDACATAACIERDSYILVALESLKCIVMV
jgi:hypothetical protein